MYLDFSQRQRKDYVTKSPKGHGWRFMTHCFDIQHTVNMCLFRRYTQYLYSVQVYYPCTKDLMLKKTAVLLSVSHMVSLERGLCKICKPQVLQY